MHGANGVAVPVVCEGVPCVLKVAWPDQELQDQVLGLRLWSGHGMVRLLEAELDDGALLLERLDMTCTLRSQPVTEALTVAGELLGRLSVPAARDGEAADGLATLPTCPEVADAFLQSADERAAALGHPVPAAVLAMAQRLARGLTDVDSDRLLNADLHDENILAAAREPWLAIDPRVMIGVPEYGIAQLLWWRLEDIENDLGLRRAFDLLVSVAQLDAELARAWTIVRSVDYWLWGRANGLTIDPVRCARVVDGLA
jgi:streptomycin 6-kinase